MNNEIVLATNVGKLNVSELQSKVMELVRWAHNRAGSKKDADFETIIRFDTNEICRDLQTIPEFKGLKLQDLSKIFQKGLSGGYGDFYGLNCVTYAKWIRAYLSEQKTPNGQIEHEAVKFRISQEKTLTQAEKDAISETNFKTVLDKWRRTGIIQDYGSACYYYLERIGKINLSVKEKNEYMQRAEKVEHQRLQYKLEEAKSKLDKVAKITIEREFDDLMTGSEKVKATAKELALIDYFKTV